MACGVSRTDSCVSLIVRLRRTLERPLGKRTVKGFELSRKLFTGKLMLMLAFARQLANLYFPIEKVVRLAGSR